MILKMKKCFLVFLCTVLLVFNISVTLVKPLPVKAVVAEAATAAVVIEGVELLLDLVAAGLLAIGAYELYENDERMQIVIDSYVDTWKDPATGVFSPGRTWGDVEDTTGTFVRDPNTGQWVRNPDTIPSTERPVILTPEEQEYYGVSSNYYENVKDIAWEIWQKNHGSGNGGGSGGGDEGGGSETGSDKGSLVKIGTGVITSVGAFIATITSGNSGNETIDSWVNEVPMPTYDGIHLKDAEGNYLFRCRGSYNNGTETTKLFYYGTVATLPFAILSDDRLNFMRVYNDSYRTTTLTQENITTNNSTGSTTTKYVNASFTAYNSYYNFSINVPVFTSIESAEAYIKNGDDSACINKDKPKLTWLDMHDISGRLSSILGSFTSPNGKALKKSALKDYTKAMVDYKTSASDEELVDPEAQEKKATEEAEKASGQNTVEDPSPEEEEEPKPQPMPSPEYPTPEKITIEDIDATRDWRLVFPFCIPFDMIDLFKVLAAEPKAPYWEIPLRVESFGFEYTFVIDFEQFDSLAEIFRLCETIAFILGLALITGKVIKW